MTHLLVCAVVIYLSQSANFDMHHDGLITTNFLELRNSFKNDGFWPFNQYGVTWLIPYLPIILSGETDSIFQRANLVSLVIYYLTLILSFIAARKFLSTTLSVLVPVFISATASLSSLRTWPSVSAMLYLSCFLLAAISYFTRGASIKSLRRSSLFMGVLIPMIIFSRVQVGIILLLVFSILVFKLGTSKTRRYFYSAIILETLLIALFLQRNNWLAPALKDTFVYSLNYLTNDEARVVPFFTLIGSLSVLLVFYTLLSERLPFKLGWILSCSVVCAFFCLVVLYVKTSLNEGPDSITLYIILMRRLFVATLIATFLYFFICQLREILKSRGNLASFQNSQMLALVLVAGASLLQLMPLFDSTHAWWASPPLAILLLVLVNRVSIKYFEFIRAKLALKTLAIVSISVLLFSLQTNNQDKSRLVSFGSNFMSNTFGFNSEISEQKKLSEIVFSVAPRGSKLLNLCINSNIFLTTKGYQSASRFYITWPNMSGYPEFINATSTSDPDFILTCSDLPNPAVGVLTEQDRNVLRLSQEKIINQIFPRPTLIGEFQSAREVQWQLWFGGD